MSPETGPHASTRDVPGAGGAGPETGHRVALPRVGAQVPQALDVPRPPEAGRVGASSRARLSRHPVDAEAPTPAASISAPAPMRKPFSGAMMAPLLLGVALNPVNSTMIATALVAIGHAFGVGVAQTAWLVASLYLASAVGQPTMGRLADLIGPRLVFLGGLVVVLAAGLVGALAPAFGWLIASRVLLGIGTSAAYPSAMAMLRTESRRAGVEAPRRVLGRLSLASLASAAVGPVLGGALAATLGWRAVFAVNIPAAVAGLVLAWRWAPADPQRAADRGRISLDPPGLLLFAATIATTMLFLMNLAHPNWLLLVLAALLGTALVRWELRADQPFLDLRLLGRSPGLTRTFVRSGLTYLVLYCMLYGFSQWLQESHGLSAFHAGLIALPMSATAAVFSLLGARTRTLRAPLLALTVLLGIGSALLLVLDAGTPIVVLVLVSTVFGVGQGLASSSNQAAVYAQAPAEGTGSSAGLQRTSIYLGAILSSSVLALLFGSRATDVGLHGIAVVMGVLSAALLLLTLADRALGADR
ncbi:MFS family permease [Streptacidiphilus sp. MAP12-33]|uniref:MFS transporter n=1 Tax=Streptacidiphilus sp. MAP12-33 TaxID=3156266 RepID=UPI0035186E17